MKKLFAVFFVIVVAFSLVGCQPNEIDIYVPDGAPALAVASVIADGDFYGKSKVNVHIVTEDNVVPNILNGQADVALLPGNTAATLYNKGAGYSLLSANSFGLLYLVGTGEQDIKQLEGKVVLSIGKGKIPEFVFKIILEHNGLEYEDSDVAVPGKVAIKYMNGPEIVASLVQGLADCAVLGEPVVTQVLQKGQQRGIAIIQDLQQAWKQYTGAETFVQSCAVVSDSLKGSDFIDALSVKLQQNQQYITENTDSLSDILKQAGSALQVQFTAEIIERCNLDFVKATEVRSQFEDFLSILIEWDANTVEGGLPDDGFYLQ